MSALPKKLFKIVKDGGEQSSKGSPQSENDDNKDEEEDPALKILKKPRKQKGLYYMHSENKEIVEYVTKDKTRFLEANNMSFWVEAENNGLCVGRSAASLHERWRKLSVQISQYQVDANLATQIKTYATATLMARRRMKEKILGIKMAIKGPKFQRKEDKAILDFMKEDPKRDNFRNNLHLWDGAEKLDICPGRTSTSMMLRYRRLRQKKTGSSRKKKKKQMERKSAAEDSAESSEAQKPVSSKATSSRRSTRRKIPSESSDSVESNEEVREPSLSKETSSRPRTRSRFRRESSDSVESTKEARNPVLSKETSPRRRTRRRISSESSDSVESNKEVRKRALSKKSSSRRRTRSRMSSESSDSEEVRKTRSSARVRRTRRQSDSDDDKLVIDVDGLSDHDSDDSNASTVSDPMLKERRSSHLPPAGSHLPPAGSHVPPVSSSSEAQLEKLRREMLAQKINFLLRDQIRRKGRSTDSDSDSSSLV